VLDGESLGLLRRTYYHVIVTGVCYYLRLGGGFALLKLLKRVDIHARHTIVELWLVVWYDEQCIEWVGWSMFPLFFGLYMIRD